MENVQRLSFGGERNIKLTILEKQILLRSRTEVVIFFITISIFFVLFLKKGESGCHNTSTHSKTIFLCIM